MDDEMIERCAGAFLREFFSRDVDDQIISATQHESDHLIIAVIKAMREPTTPIVEALFKKNGFLPNGKFWADIWNEGIDAITGAE